MNPFFMLVDGEKQRKLLIYNEEDNILGENYPPVMTYWVVERADGGVVYRHLYNPWVHESSTIIWMGKPEGDEREWIEVDTRLQKVTGVYRNNMQPAEDIEIEKAVLELFVGDAYQCIPPIELCAFMRLLGEIGIVSDGNR